MAIVKADIAALRIPTDWKFEDPTGKDVRVGTSSRVTREIDSDSDTLKLAAVWTAWSSENGSGNGVFRVTATLQLAPYRAGDLSASYTLTDNATGRNVLSITGAIAREQDANRFLNVRNDTQLYKLLLQGDDRIVGSAHDDAYQNFGGRDFVWGLAGDDLIKGGSADILRGGDGDDRIEARGFLINETAKGYIDGGNGDDMIKVAFFHRAYGGYGDDTVIGLTGSAGMIHGGPGEDTLVGRGKAIVKGGLGDDTIAVHVNNQSKGYGLDVTGGRGADDISIVINNAALFGSTKIRGFNPNEDTISIKVKYAPEVEGVWRTGSGDPEDPTVQAVTGAKLAGVELFDAVTNLVQANLNEVYSDIEVDFPDISNAVNVRRGNYKLGGYEFEDVDHFEARLEDLETVFDILKAGLTGADGPNKDLMTALLSGEVGTVRFGDETATIKAVSNHADLARLLSGVQVQFEDGASIIVGYYNHLGFRKFFANETHYDRLNDFAYGDVSTPELTSRQVGGDAMLAIGDDDIALVKSVRASSLELDQNVFVSKPGAVASPWPGLAEKVVAPEALGAVNWSLGSNGDIDFREAFDGATAATVTEGWLSIGESSALTPEVEAALAGRPSGEISHLAVGGNDDDTLYTQDFDDFSWTNVGAQIFGMGGDDNITATAAFKRIPNLAFGGDGDDYIVVAGQGFGGADNDVIFGYSETSDVLDGGTGADRMLGRGGDDTYFVDDFNDVVRELANHGHDVVYSTIAYALPDHIEELRFIGDAAIVWGGGAEAEDVWGNDADNTLDGGAGDDRLYGEGGDDVLSGGIGADMLAGNAGEDEIFGGAGGDSITGGGGDDDVRGGDGDDFLYGQAGDDRLRGDAGDDVIYGGDGDDLIEGGAGQDLLVGGIGDDRYVVTDAAAIIKEFNVGGGYDVVTVQTSGYRAAYFTEEVRLDLAEGGTLYGGLYQDNLFGGAGDDIIKGRGDHDSIAGGAGADVLLGQVGYDTLRGEDGNDVLIGGDGRDNLYGGAGADSFVFEVGGDLDRLRDFTVGEDLLDVRAFDLADFAALQALMSDRASGDAQINFGDGDIAILYGVASADILERDVLL